MIRVDVKDASGALTHTSQQPDAATAQAWIDSCVEQGFWDDTATVTQTDTTALEAAQAQLAESDQAMQVGRAVLVQIRTLNKQKAMTGAQVAGLFQDPTLLFLLLTGSLTLAKGAIQNFSNPIYTADDKALLVSIIDQSGLAD